MKYTVDGDTLTLINGKKTESYTIVELTSSKMTLKDDNKSREYHFTKVDDSLADQNISSKADLKTANANAKLVFVTLNNTASDLIADNISVDKLDYSGPVSDLPDNDLGRAVKSALKDNGAEDGYVRIYFDPNYDYDDYDDETENYAMYSKSESGGVVGRYPNPPKTVDEAKELSI